MTLCGYGSSGSTSKTTTTTTPLTNKQVFSRPVLSRAYEGGQWVLRNASGTGARQTSTSVGTALAYLKPTYVSGLIYLTDADTVSPTMIADYGTMRTAVLAKNPNAKFDVEISINPSPLNGQPFASASALVAFMATVDAQMHPDGWWFDFYSVVGKSSPEWIAVAIAHAHAETAGGNVFDSTFQTNSNAISFVDDTVAGSQYGFDFNRKEVTALQAALGSTILAGHLQSNPQNGSITESCVYMQQQWTEAQRAAYLNHWASQQATVGFSFMYPVFYPWCPGAYAYDPLLDALTGGTLYTYLQTLVQQCN